MILNKAFENLAPSYLFRRIAQEVGEYKAANPDALIIRLGIGDVTRPIPEAVTGAMEKAARELSREETFRGYDDDGIGYEFLRSAIASYYAAKGIALGLDEIIVSDGAKSDLGNILDIFGGTSHSLIPDPVYPAYLDVNTMNGRCVSFIGGNEQNGFLPLPSDYDLSGGVPDLIYICSPNNPTGACYSKAGLTEWVNFANLHNAVILFDSAYEGFIADKSLPSSIFEVEGARTCAIEIATFSKLAGFTGVRCGYTIVPRELIERESGTSLLALWRRRQTTKFNGVSYVTQRGAEAALLPEGLRECRANVAYYLENARILGDALTKLGTTYFGGENSPYIWFKVPGGDSWKYFDFLLREKHLVGTPGAGFGTNGEGFMRLTAFGKRENVIEAARRLA